MSSEHDDFAFFGGAGNFGDGVVGFGVVFVEGGFDIDLDFDFLVVVYESREAVVVFGDHGELERAGIFASFVGAIACDADDA